MDARPSAQTPIPTDSAVPVGAIIDDSLPLPLLGAACALVFALFASLLHPHADALELMLWAGMLAAVLFRLWGLPPSLGGAEPERQRQLDKSLFALAVLWSLLFLRGCHFLAGSTDAMLLPVGYGLMMASLLVRGWHQSRHHLALAGMLSGSIAAGPVLLGGQSAWLWLPASLALLVLAVLTGAAGRRHRDTTEQRMQTLEARIQHLEQELALATSAVDEAESETLEKSRFLAAASHDLRQPLQSISLLLYSLENRLSDPEIKELIVDLERSHQSMNDLFTSLLELSRLDARAVDVTRSAVSLARVFGNLRTELMPLAHNKGLELSIEPVTLHVDSDAMLLTRVFRNLLHNAIVHTDTGRIGVQFEIGQKAVTVHIADTGPGIPEHEQKNIFSEFYQLHRGESRPKQGVGLGLSIVSRLCALLGHDIALRSQPGRGTTFSVTLALTASPEHIAGAGTITLPALEQLHHLQVLVIDDDPVNVRALQKTLSAWQCGTVAALGVDEALKAIGQQRGINFVLCDYHLGRQASLTGVQLFQRLTQVARRPLAGLLVTADPNPAILKEAQLAGIQVLPKPVQAAKLRNAIIRTLHLNQRTESGHY
jgi:signal transduction histidine kinase/CheY-like chemotaxis protein